MEIEFNENHLREMTEITERAKSNTHRLDVAENDIKELKERNSALFEMSASIRNLSEGIVDIKSDVKDIKSEQGEMKTEISDLKNAPMRSKSKAFDTAWKFVVSAIGGAFVGWLITTLIPQFIN